MKALQLLCYLLIITLVFSCKEEEDLSPDPISPIYYNLNLDSYWVYQWYRIDTSGVETVLNTIDTIRNIPDTIINGNQFIVQSGTFLGGHQADKFLRDSNGDLVDEKGRILFSSTNFTDVLRRDTIASNEPLIAIEYQMASSEFEEITTLAGTFSCLNYQGNHESFVPSFPWETRLSNSYYGVGIGEVQSSVFFASSLNDLERRLVEFELK